MNHTYDRKHLKKCMLLSHSYMQVRYAWVVSLSSAQEHSQKRKESQLSVKPLLVALGLVCCLLGFFFFLFSFYPPSLPGLQLLAHAKGREGCAPSSRPGRALAKPDTCSCQPQRVHGHRKDLSHAMGSHLTQHNANTGEKQKERPG